MPLTSEPRTAATSNSVAVGGALPIAIAVCPRGIARVWMMVPVAGSQSQ